MRFFPEGFWLLCVAATCSARSEGGNKARSCSELRQLYGAKGFSPNVVPQAEISGEHLRICPQGYTCCTSEMEENFANKSRSEFEGMLKEATRSVQIIFTAQYKNFDDPTHCWTEREFTDDKLKKLCLDLFKKIRLSKFKHFVAQLGRTAYGGLGVFEGLLRIVMETVASYMLPFSALTIIKGLKSRLENMYPSHFEEVIAVTIRPQTGQHFSRESFQ